MNDLNDAGIRTSAFIDADISQIEAANTCGFCVCEIHTGQYAEAVISNGFSLDHDEVREHRTRICEAVAQVNDIGMQCNAGHGLTHHNVGEIASIEGILELHIGHSIISRSVITGIRISVEEMKQCIKDASK